VETDPVHMMESLLGIPGVRVVEIEEEPPRLRVEIETSATTATCPICGFEAALDDVVTVDLGEHSALGQRVHLEWRKRQWRCEAPKCRARSWPERDKEIEAFLVRSPHRMDRSKQ
jgi:transposase